MIVWASDYSAPHSDDAFSMSLLHFDGAGGSTVITDSGGSHTWTASGNAQIDTAQSKFGGASGLFDGTGDYVSTPDHADFTVGTGDFTVEFWFQANDAGGAVVSPCGQVDVAGGANVNTAWYFEKIASNVIILKVVSGVTVTTVTGVTEFTNAINTGWHHVAAVRVSNVLKLFIDGVQEGGDVAYVSTINNSTATLTIGRVGDFNGQYWNGWIDEFRFSVGTARYTANFALDADDDDPPGTPWIGWDNIVTAGGITTDTEEDNFPATNLANPATHLFWRGAFVTSAIENITIVTGTVDLLNYVGVAKHNWGSEGIAVTLQGKIIGNSPDVWATIISSFIPADDLPLIMRFEPTPLSEVRIVLTGGTDVPQAAVVYVGELLVMERGIVVDSDHVPLTYGRRNTIVNGMSESGHFTGRIKLKEWRESTAVFAHFTPSWYRANFEPFVEQASETPFFYAWHPITYPLETGYAWMTNDPMPETSPVTERVSFEIAMRGVA